MQVAPDVGSSPWWHELFSRWFWGALKLQKGSSDLPYCRSQLPRQFTLYFSKQPKTRNFFSSFQYYFFLPLGRFDPNLTNARIFFQDGLGWDHRNDRHMPGLWGIKLRMVSLLTQSCYTGFRGRKFEFDKPPSRFSGWVQNSRSFFFNPLIYIHLGFEERVVCGGYINQVRISFYNKGCGVFHCLSLSHIWWVESRQHSEVEPQRLHNFRRENCLCRTFVNGLSIMDHPTARKSASTMSVNVQPLI